MKGLDLAAKPLSKIGASAQLRKRLSRKSPGPELRKTLRSIPPPTNVTGPETVSLTPKKKKKKNHQQLCPINDMNKQ